MRRFLPLVAALVLASGAGYLASVALSSGKQQPTKTVTISATGEQGPTGPAGVAGPPGPAGEPGAESCPAGYTFAAVVFNTPGGHDQIATCLKD